MALQDFAGAAKKVLVVDDEESILESTAMLLKMFGYRVVTLENAQEVLPVALRERPDLILQDLRMPALSPDDLMKRLRENPFTARIPVVFFSALPSLAEWARSLRAQGQLAKPFQPEELQQLIEALTKSRHYAWMGMG